MQECPRCGAYLDDGVTQCPFCNRGLGPDVGPTEPTEFSRIAARLQKQLDFIPITSIHSPLDWSYSVNGLVTAQSVIGTGLVSQIASSFTDLFGAQSGVYTGKLRSSEELCKAILRAETLRQGGNAIVAADLDYAEVGGSHAMLMVCMTGTAVYLRNTEILGEERQRGLVSARSDYLRWVELTGHGRIPS